MSQKGAPKSYGRAVVPNLRILWSFVRPYHRTLLVGLVLGLVVTAATLAGPLATKWVLDGLADSRPIAPAVAVLAGLLVVGSGVQAFQWILLGRMGEQVVRDARGSLVRRLLRLRMGELAGRSSGELVTRVTSDTVLLREAAASSLPQLVNGAVGLVGALVLMAFLDRVLFAVTLASLAVVAVIVAVLMPRMAKSQAAAQEAVGRLGAALDGALRAIRTVKSARAEDREAARIEAEADASARHSVAAVRIEAVVWTITLAGVQLAILLILAVGAYRVDSGALPVSSLIAFILYAFQIVEPATELARVFSQLQSGIAAASRIAQLRELPTEQAAGGSIPLPEKLSDTPSPTHADAISFHNVTARYADDAPAALDFVTLGIPPVGHTAIVGPSGAGKTTLFSLMREFLPPESGELRLGGVPFDRHPGHESRRRIAYVEQDAPLLPGTLADNLRYQRPSATDDELWDALRAVRLDERAKALPDGLDTVLADATVSGGERQRIALARAFVAAADIMLLDEATAQLDGLTEAAVQHFIRERARYAAVVTIAHRLSTVVEADRIVVLELGRVRAIGTHAELLDTDTLYRDMVTALRVTTAIGDVSRATPSHASSG
ncbi:MAG: ABC transporter ATP-binding protein [Streptomycetaceae bacterium]|nr:ABC transporter ATP-binding protein [Streptomycetaceae bacterium]